MKIKNVLILVFSLYIHGLQGQNVVNFTSDEGFSNGPLYDQDGWDANFQTSTWNVNANQGVVSSYGEWKRAAWGQGFVLSGAGDQITFRVDLNFTGQFVAINNPLIKIGFSSSSSVGSSNPISNTVFLSSTEDNEENPGGSLQLRNNLNTAPLNLDTILPLSECQGLNGTSDDLAVLVTLTLGTDEASSVISAKLINVSDGTFSSTGSYSGISLEVFNAATTNIYGFFHAQSFKNGAPLTALNVKKVSMSTNVDIYPKTKRKIGEISTLERSKYFNIHSNPNDVEYNFYTDYNVSQSGRGFWSPGSAALQNTGVFGTYPGPLSGNTELREVRKYIATDHPYNVYEQGLDPVAFADWAVEYYKNYVDVYLRPEYYEPMNEPFVHARDFYDEPDWDPVAEATVKMEMTNFFKNIAQKIHAAPELANMKVIGFSDAFPSYEKNDFSKWNENMKMFMDEAGEEMDAFSTHLYDGVNQIGQDTKRSGSNMEAILDLIETYSNLKWGVIKPHAITEFGGIENGVYNDVNNVQSLRSQNSMLFGLLERTNRMEIAIPFNTGKSTWHINEQNNYLPYKAALYKPIPLGVPLDQVTGWELTNRVYFYEFWKDVSGERILVRSDNRDVQVQAFVDNNKLFVGLNNLDDFDQTVSLNMNGNLPDIDNVTIKSLIIHPNTTVNYSSESYTSGPEAYTLKKDETVLIQYDFDTAIVFENTIQSENYYSTNYLQPILTNLPINFNFNNVTVGNSGYATLGMSIGRNHDRSKSPTLLFNGVTISVPSNWKGYDQSDRDDFFGTIEIDIPINLIQQSNTVSITFPDTGGHLSSLVLKVEASDTASLAVDETVIALNKLKIFPNPSSGQVQVKGAEMGSLISIYSLSGAKIYISKYDGLPINLKYLTDGLYFIKINNTTLKLLIKH